MTSQKIEESIDYGSLSLARSQKNKLKINFVSLLIPILLIGYISINDDLKNGKTPILAIVPLLLVALLIRDIYSRTKLVKYKTNLSKDQFIRANVSISLLNDWIIISNTEEYFSAIQIKPWQWDGIRISAILKEERIYVNSMVNPSERSIPFTFGWNKKNVRELLLQYQMILKVDNIEKITKDKILKREEDLWNESEWTVKNTFKRIIGYLLSFAFFIFSYLLILEGEISSIIMGIILIVLSSVYVFFDVKVIVEKMKKSTKR